MAAERQVSIMTDQELRDLVGRLGESLEESKKEHDRILSRLSKQLGELGNKWGSFAEGMALPSMTKVLKKKFGLDIVLPRATSHLNGETLEVDVLAFDKEGRDEAYVVEVKSHFRDDGIKQILKTIHDLPEFFPFLADRKIYGIVAAVDIPANLQQAVLKQGLYLARISDETFRLQVPPNFKPRVFGENGRKKNGTPKRAKRSK
jgi:hypothetical protein